LIEIDLSNKSIPLLAPGVSLLVGRAANNLLQTHTSSQAQVRKLAGLLALARWLLLVDSGRKKNSKSNTISYRILQIAEQNFKLQKIRKDYNTY
jgi:hypothetical protein